MAEVKRALPAPAGGAWPTDQGRHAGIAHQTLPRGGLGRRGALLAAADLAVVARSAKAAPATAAVTAWPAVSEVLVRGANWRSTTIAQLAAHDALNAIRPRFERYAPPAAEEPAPAGASPEAAAAAAAHAALLAFHPGERARLDAVLERVLEAVPRDGGRAAGLALGAVVGRATAERRIAADGPDFGRRAPFPASEEKGRWRPTPPDFSPGVLAWLGRVRPMLLPSADALRPSDPPPHGSPQNLRDFEEVRLFGRAEGSLRTPEQTAAALFWEGTSATKFTPVAAAARFAEHPPGDLWETARALALLAAAVSDSQIVTIEAKGHFLTWRPITALREGLPGLPADPSWLPLVRTPDHPEYLAGLAAAGVTAARMLAAIYGTEEVPLAIGPEGRERRFAGLQELAREACDARIWSGIHLRTTNEDTAQMAEALVRHALGTRLRAVGTR